MRLSEILGHQNVQAMLEEMLEPTTTKPPREKGPDAIRVNGYVVHGFWRRRWHESIDANIERRRRRRAQALTPSEREESEKIP